MARARESLIDLDATPIIIVLIVVFVEAFYVVMMNIQAKTLTIDALG